MDFKFNKTFSSFILSLILLSIIGALPISRYIYSLMDIGTEISYSYSFSDIFKTLIYSLFISFDRILIGISFYIFSPKFQHDKISWTVIGFVYGEIALVLLLLSFIIKGLRAVVDLKKYAIQFLIFFSIAVLFSAILSIGIPILLNYASDIIEKAKYDVYTDLIKYVKFIPIFIFHIALIFKFRKGLINLDEENKIIWLLCTLFLGLIPIIVYYQLFMTERKIKNAA